MFSLKEKRSARSRIKAERNRNPEAVVHLSHDTTTHGAAVETKNTPVKTEPINISELIPAHWDDIIFANRNREYGAYALRKGYLSNLTIGLAYTILLVTFLMFYPTLVKFFTGVEQVETAPPRKLVYTELSAPPPIDKPKPPPPQIQLPRLQKVIKFVPPKVVKEEIAQVAPTIAEIKEHETAAVAVDGPAQVIFDEPVGEIIAEDDNELFTIVDQQPEFEGGYAALMAFVQQNMKYPTNARRLEVEGTVHVGFVVSKTGAISDVKVLRGFMAECDKEAVRVVQMMPPWKPGKQNGRNVNVRFVLPLKFRLN